MSHGFENVATMTDARKIMIQEQIENDRKLTVLYQKRGRIRDFNDENRIKNYGGYDETVTLSFADKFTNKNVINGTIELSSFSIYQITSLEDAFSDCTELETIDLSPLNLDFCSSYRRAFSGCINLRSIKFGHQCTMNLKDTSYMFYNCKKLMNIDTGSYDKNQLDWNTSQVIDFSNMFCNCESLTSLNLDCFDTSAAIGTSKMFMNCKHLLSLRVGSWDLTSDLDLGFMFAGCQELKYLDVSRWNLQSAKSTRYMFYQCESLQYIDLSAWKCNLEDMSSMFENCRCIEEIDISNVQSKDLFDLSNIFYDCESLISLKLPSDILNAETSMTRMLSNCKLLPKITIESKLSEDVREMFRNCESLKEIKLQPDQMNDVKYMDDLFANCTNITVLDLSKQNCKPNSASCMFNNCNKLEVLDISGIDFTNADTYGTFDNLDSLQLVVMKEIEGLYYIKDDWLYLAGEKFSIYHKFKRENGILTVALIDGIDL